MKKMMAVASALLLMMSCTRDYLQEDPDDKWNGYERYLKMGEQTHILKAGKHLAVGMATYGIDENANFYVTYDCSGTEWWIRETHLFAGDKQNMPLNRRDQPRVCRFPFKKVHVPKVKSYTYRIPLSSLPPAEEPGFAVAAECVVYSYEKCGGHEKVAWAEGDFKFTDKGNGWYDVFYYNQPENEFTILYGIACVADSLKLYHVDVTHGIIELTYVEYVGNTAGSYDAAAYDPESGRLLFAKVNTNELWVNCLEEDDSSFLAGVLQGQVLSATFFNGTYYYVDASANAIHGVTFTENWNIASDASLDTIPGTIEVNDMAMDPDGEMLHIIGRYNGGNTELIVWNATTHTFYFQAVPLSPGTQIAYGSDGVLYGMAHSGEPGDSAEVWIIDVTSDSLVVVPDEVIIFDDPFSDIARGPVM